jgi:hypothetical protein
MGMGIGMMVGIIGTKAAATKETYDASSGRKMYEIMTGNVPEKRREGNTLVYIEKGHAPVSN